MSAIKSHTELPLADEAFAASIGYYEAARTVLPRGLTSAARGGLLPVPPVLARMRGAHCWDIDGNEYVDMVCAFGPALLGHLPEHVVDAVARQMQIGVTFGAQHLGELELAEAICRTVPGIEMASLSNSGTESIQHALRITRAYTGRSTIVRFDGHYHGWVDPVAVPGDPGADSESDRLTISIPWNDEEALRSLFAVRGAEIAAVIMEPVPCNQGIFKPKPGYLQAAKDMCVAAGALLIFDEVITGYRTALGGAQELFGVTPHLTILAKAMGSGFPIAAVGGCREVMSVAGDNGPLNLMGTYNGHGVGVAAGIASIKYLSASVDEVYPRLEANGAAVAAVIEDVAQEVGVPLTSNRIGSALQVYAGLESQPRSFEEAQASDGKRIARVAEELLRRGVYALPRGLWFVSAAHGDSELEHFSNALRLAVPAAWREAR